MEQRIEDLKLDVVELEKLQSLAERVKVKEILGLQIRKLQTNISQLMEESSTEASATQAVTDQPVAVTKTAVRRMVNTITNYGWDQSEKFMKIYVTLNGVQDIPKEQITSSFTDRSFKVAVTDLDGKDHVVHIVNLNDDILPADSSHKVKTDMVLLMLKKKQSGKTWPYVIAKEEKKEKPVKKPAEDKDPGAGLMDMLKQMYDSGDDEMKKSISKAWTDSRNKSPEMDMGL